MQLIRNFIQADLAGGKKMEPAQLVSAMDEAATQDIRSVQLWPMLKQALGSPSDPQLQNAIAKLDAWYADGGHRRDLTNTSISSPGTYQHNEAITIMDAWWPKLLEAEFRPALGETAFDELRGMLEFGSPNPGGEPAAPDFADGWYGYVSKDLRDVLAANGLGIGRAAPTRSSTAAAARWKPAARRCRARCCKRCPSRRSRSTATANAPKTRRRAALT